ncbi:MAG: Flp pilus assembly protein CpaB, partial [bacterium]
SRIEGLRDEIIRMSERMDVIAAGRDIPVGARLEDEDMIIVSMLKDQLPKRSVPSEDLDLLHGRRVLHPIPQGDVILWTDLPEGPRIHKTTEQIPSGYRAIALTADEVHTLIHVLSPGDRVDVVSTTFQGSSSKAASRVLAEDLTVLGVGRRFDDGAFSGEGEEYPLSVTLLAGTQTALEILQASQAGEIHFLAKGSDLFAEKIK